MRRWSSRASGFTRWKQNQWHRWQLRDDFDSSSREDFHVQLDPFSRNRDIWRRREWESAS